MARDLHIPLHYLCHNLSTLAKFWSTDNNEINSADELEKDQSIADPLTFAKNIRSPENTPVKSGLTGLVAETKQKNLASPSIGSIYSPRLHSTPSSSISSSLSKSASAKQLDEKAKTPHEEAAVNGLHPPVLSPNTNTDKKEKSSAEKILINGTQPLTISSPSMAIQPPPSVMPAGSLNSLLSKSIKPVHGIFKFEEEQEEEHSEQDITLTSNPTIRESIAASVIKRHEQPGKSIHRRESLLARHVPTTEKPETPVKPISETTVVDITKNKRKINLKLSVSENNCLAAMMYLLSGVKDSKDRFGIIPLCPEPSALELAAYYGHVYCLALIAKITVDLMLFDRALKLAVKYEKDDCVLLLLNEIGTSFSSKADIYIDIKYGPSQKNKKFLKILLDSHLTLLQALECNHVDLIRELTTCPLPEKPEETNNIIMLAAERGHACCLTQQRLKTVDISTINVAVVNAAQYNHIECLTILLQPTLDTNIKINALLAHMKSLKAFCTKNIPEPKWRQYFLAEKSFILFFHILTPSEIQTAFVKISKSSDPLFIKVFLELDKLSLVQMSQPDNTCAFLKLDKATLVGMATLMPEAIAAIQKLESPDNITKLIDIYNLIMRDKVHLIKREKLIEISLAAKTDAFIDALKRNDIDMMLTLFNTGINVELEKEAIKKILANNDLRYRGKLIEYSLNNFFTLSLLLKHNVPDKKTVGVLHSVTELANLDCLKLLLDSDFDINRIDAFPITKKIPINVNTQTDKNATASMSSLKTFPNTNAINSHMLNHKNTTASMSSLSILKTTASTNAVSEKTFIISTGTIAMLAAYLGHIECLEYILQRGTGRGDPRTPADLSIQLPANYHFNYQKLEVDVNATTSDNQKNILAQNAKEINTRFSGYSVFHFAVRDSYCLQLLIQSPKFKIEMLNLLTTEKDTALHISAVKNKFKSVDILLAAGADPFITNNNNETPLMLAIRLTAKDAYESFIKHKQLFDNKPAPKLNALFESALRNKNIEQLSLIIDCLFSAKITWNNQAEIVELFQSFLHIVVRHSNFEASMLFKPYINKYFKLDFNENEASIEFLGESFIALKQRENFLEIIRFAINKQSWKIAKSLLEYISSQQHFRATSYLNDQEAVILLLKLNELEELMPKKEATISLNLNP